MPSYFYHVVANIDTEFDSAAECLRHYTTTDGRPIVFKPTIPATRAPGEDDATPRIPVCRKLTDCFSAVGLLGRFRRCLGGNEDAKSYAECMNEAYPVLVCRFDGALPSYKPTKEQVEDVDTTHELWLTKAARPVDVTIKWLNAESITWLDEDHPQVCRFVRFLRSPRECQHPWLTGTGNILESSLMDYDWYKSKYRTPINDIDRTSIMLAYARNTSINDIQLHMFPYRSKAEIKSVFKNYSPDYLRPVYVYKAQANVMVKAENTNVPAYIMHDSAAEAFSSTVMTGAHISAAGEPDTYCISIDLECAEQSEIQARRFAYGCVKQMAELLIKHSIIITQISITAEQKEFIRCSDI